MFYILLPDHDDPSLTILGSLSCKTRRGREGKELMPRMKWWMQGTATGPGPRVALGNHIVGDLQGRVDKKLWSSKHFLDPFGRQGPRNLQREQFPGKTNNLKVESNHYLENKQNQSIAIFRICSQTTMHPNHDSGSTPWSLCNAGLMNYLSPYSDTWKIMPWEQTKGALEEWEKCRCPKWKPCRIGEDGSRGASPKSSGFDSTSTVRTRSAKRPLSPFTASTTVQGVMILGTVPLLKSSSKSSVCINLQRRVYFAKREAVKRLNYRT